jgi:hypothetical protein
LRRDLLHGSKGEALSNMKDEEIERVFRAQKIPADIEKCPSENVVQGYLAIDEAGAEIRLRKKGDRYFQTFKGSGHLRWRELPVAHYTTRSLWGAPLRARS